MTNIFKSICESYLLSDLGEEILIAELLNWNDALFVTVLKDWREIIEW